MMEHKIHVDVEKCIGCGICAKTCVANNIEIKNQKASIILDKCLTCGQCQAVCSKEAIRMTGYHEEPVIKKQEEQLSPEEVLNVIRFRRTIRNFKDKEISHRVIQQILEAGRLTHTAKNSQDVCFVVLDKEKAAIEKIAVKICKRVKPWVDLFSPLARNTTIDDYFFFFKAPIVIVIVARNKTNGILAAQNMEFVAEANGLGVLFSGFFTSVANMSWKIKRKLGLTRGQKVAATLVLGYPKVKFLRSTQHEELKVTYK